MMIVEIVSPAVAVLQAIAEPSSVNATLQVGNATPIYVNPAIVVYKILETIFHFTRLISSLFVRQV